MHKQEPRLEYLPYLVAANHLREGHNRLNCPYPSSCSSAKYCGNLDKHPDEKQVVKDQNNLLSQERKTLKSMKEELENRQRSHVNVAQRYAARVKDVLIQSDPAKYTSEIGGKIIEDWRLINKDSALLERHFKSKIPSPEEARAAIQRFNDSTENTKIPLTGKTSVHNPYKQLWESKGISWPKRNENISTYQRGARTYQSATCHTTSTCTVPEDENIVRSPQRKEPVIDLEEDYELALGLQESLKTLPNTFDLQEFEQRVENKPAENESLIPDKELPTSSGLDVLAAAALHIGDI